MKGTELGIAPVGGQRVLRQVVGADAEEIAVLGQLVGQQAAADGTSIMMPVLHRP